MQFQCLTSSAIYVKTCLPRPPSLKLEISNLQRSVSGDKICVCERLRIRKRGDFGNPTMPTTIVPRKSPVSDIESKKLLIERLAASSYLSKSVRLRDMFLYLCERVLDHSVDVIHEHEVGHKVFGRPLDYDTNADNIVRVHASTLRKRIEQYFANEGCHEPVVIDIPRGNYAPVFRKRPPAVTTAVPLGSPFISSAERPRNYWALLPLIVISLFLLCSNIYLAIRARALRQVGSAPAANQAPLRPLWSEIFAANQNTDIVLDDAALGVFEELSGRQIALSEYFDRSYLRSVEQNARSGELPRSLAQALVLKRQSSFANASLLLKLGQIAESLHSAAKLHFARDYSFRELKADNVILLGNSRSNPWIEPFESHTALQWKYDNSLRTYYPVDTTGKPAEQAKYQASVHGSEPREGYATASLLPNLSGTGKVLIISASGGAALSSALDFLTDERSLSQLRALLATAEGSDFPYFEALLRIKSRNSLPRDTEIVIARVPKP